MSLSVTTILECQIPFFDKTKEQFLEDAKIIGESTKYVGSKLNYCDEYGFSFDTARWGFCVQGKLRACKNFLGYIASGDKVSSICYDWATALNERFKLGNFNDEEKRCFALAKRAFEQQSQIYEKEKGKEFGYVTLNFRYAAERLDEFFTNLELDGTNSGKSKPVEPVLAELGLKEFKTVKIQPVRKSELEYDELEGIDIYGFDILRQITKRLDKSEELIEQIQTEINKIKESFQQAKELQKKIEKKLSEFRI